MSGKEKREMLERGIRLDRKGNIREEKSTDKNKKVKELWEEMTKRNKEKQPGTRTTVCGGKCVWK